MSIIINERSTDLGGFYDGGIDPFQGWSVSISNIVEMQGQWGGCDRSRTISYK